MKILVTGGRRFADEALLNQTLDELHRERVITCVVHGAATGADTLAERWARRNEIAYRGYPAKWNTDGNAAGPKRNAFMLAVEHRPTFPISLVVAFPGDRGTQDMKGRARAKGIEVMEVTA